MVEFKLKDGARLARLCFPPRPSAAKIRNTMADTATSTNVALDDDDRVSS